MGGDRLRAFIRELIQAGVTLVIQRGQPRLQFDPQNKKAGSLARLFKEQAGGRRDEAIALWSEVAIAETPTDPAATPGPHTCTECAALVFADALDANLCPLLGCPFRFDRAAAQWKDYRDYKLRARKP